MSNLTIKTATSIHEIDPAAWDQLSNGKPFQSHRWYAYGERVMADCQPLYVLACEGNELVARASFWLVRNEPLPRMLGYFRKPVQTWLKYWPLLICKSPLANTTGLIMSERAERAQILAGIAESALDAAHKNRASLLIFDYMSKPDLPDWPRFFVTVTGNEPGMSMENGWASMDEYLASVGKKNRQHYKRVLREAEQLGIRIERHTCANRIEEAIPLIRSVEASHGALPNPWLRSMLEHMEMVNGLFLTATINEQLVGCGLLLEDAHSQMTSVLGLAEDIPYVYFMLVYESLNAAFGHHVHMLRWGSGAYEVKERLGFSLEDNGFLIVTAVNPILQKTLQWIN